MSKPYRRGLVVGKFSPLHVGHQDLIETALAECDQLYLWTYSNPDFPGMPAPVRMGWLRRLYPQAHLLPEAPLAPPNEAPDVIQQTFAAETLARWGVEVDVVFTSESYGPPFAARLGAAHRMVDLERARHGISGTMLRADIHGLRHKLDPRVYRDFVERVVVLGGESTGKSTLCEALAEAYQTVWVPEYGREVFEAAGGVLEVEHFAQIARGHIDQEERAMERPGVHRFVFCDTNAMTTAAFSFMMTGRAAPSLLQLADACADRYAHVLVCADETPFEQDGWRASEQVRQMHHRLLLYELHVRNIPYTVLRGSVRERVEAASRALEVPLPDAA